MTFELDNIKRRLVSLSPLNRDYVDVAIQRIYAREARLKQDLIETTALKDYAESLIALWRDKCERQEIEIRQLQAQLSMFKRKRASTASRRKV